MVVIPAGRFQMGCLSDDGNCVDDEKPFHDVQIPSAFALGRYEVTVSEFARFVEVTGYQTEAERDSESGCFTQEVLSRNEVDWTPTRSWQNLEYEIEENQPATCVSWKDARAYVAWLSDETGEVYRLPSESEWEYAARAATTTRYFFGDDPDRLCDHGNVADRTELPNGLSWTSPAACSDGEAFPATVGSYRANEFGLHDMHGNVSEWVEDCWNASYADAPGDGSAWLTGECEWRVLRGGHYRSLPSSLRSAARSYSATGFRANIYGNRFDFSGFRVARVLTP